MNALTYIALAMSLLSSYSVASEDILNFKNNDTLHGEFLGFENTTQFHWKTPQSPENLSFSTKSVRKIIFNNGLSRQKFTHSSLVTLSNGDVLPCQIKSISENEVHVVTDFAGAISIARKHVSSCTINPLGQQIAYQGPYQPNNWIVKPLNKKELENKPPNQKEIGAPWEFGSFGWYNKSSPGAVFLKDFELPHHFRFLFSVESRRYTNMSLIFNADFKNTDLAEGKGNRVNQNSVQKMLQLAGSCLVLRVNSNSTSLSQYSLSDDGEPIYTNLKSILGHHFYKQSTNQPFSKIELRVNSTKQIYSVFRNGQLANQWDLADIENIPSGKGFGFLSQTTGDSNLTRISDIVIAPWNTVMDSAKSLESDRTDIALLSNGTDRFSGDIVTMDDTSLHLNGPYAQMKIPVSDLQSLNFNLSKTSIPSARQPSEVSFQFSSRGQLNAKPIGSTDSKVLINHSILGELSIDFNYLTAISYDPSPSLLDQWNTKFK